MNWLHRTVVHLTNRRFLKMFVLPNVGFLIVAALTTAQTLIPVLNLIVIALSVNVCVAFAPNALSAIFEDRPINKADLLSLGILCSWFALVLRTMWSLAWRWLGEPMWLTNTDATSYFVYMAACGALFHLLAPGAMDETIPPRRWIKIGAWIGIAVFLGLLLVYASDLREALRGRFSPNDRAATPSSLITPL